MRNLTFKQAKKILISNMSTPFVKNSTCCCCSHFKNYNYFACVEKL